MCVCMRVPQQQLAAEGGSTRHRHTLPHKVQLGRVLQHYNKQTDKPDLIRLQAALSHSLPLFCCLTFSTAASFCFPPLSLWPLLPLTLKQAPPHLRLHPPFALSPVEQPSSGGPAGLPSWSNPLWQLSSCCYVVGLFGPNAAVLEQVWTGRTAAGPGSVHRSTGPTKATSQSHHPCGFDRSLLGPDFRS